MNLNSGWRFNESLYLTLRLYCDDFGIFFIVGGVSHSGYDCSGMSSCLKWSGKQDRTRCYQIMFRGTSVVTKLIMSVMSHSMMELGLQFPEKDFPLRSKTDICPLNWDQALFDLNLTNSIDHLSLNWTLFEHCSVRMKHGHGHMNIDLAWLFINDE